MPCSPEPSSRPLAGYCLPKKREQKGWRTQGNDVPGSIRIQFLERIHVFSRLERAHKGKNHPNQTCHSSFERGCNPQRDSKVGNCSCPQNYGDHHLQEICV